MYNEQKPFLKHTQPLLCEYSLLRRTQEEFASMDYASGKKVYLHNFTRCGRVRRCLSPNLKGLTLFWDIWDLKHKVYYVANLLNKVTTDNNNRICYWTHFFTSNHIYSHCFYLYSNPVIFLWDHGSSIWNLNKPHSGKQSLLVNFNVSRNWHMSSCFKILYLLLMQNAILGQRRKCGILTGRDSRRSYALNL